MKTKGESDNLNKENVKKGPRVLMVMEEPESLGHYASLFRALGYEVLACDSYRRGLDMLRRGNFDLVTVGQGGTLFEGRKVVMEALERDRNTPVLVFARTSNMNNYLEAMQLGAVDYLETPVPPEELTRVLRTHLRYRPAA